MSNKSPDALLDEVNRFLATTGMGSSYFGKASVGNSELVKRLRSGRPIMMGTADRIRDFMVKNKGKAKRKAKAKEGAPQ